MLPPERIPALVDESGEFHTDLVAAGFRFFFLPAARRQLEAEIRAQFEAFRASGLALDHANAHNHMHLHPTVLSTLLRVGRDFGLSAVRVPHEPGTSAALTPWIAWMRSRLRRAGIRCNDQVLGLRDTGQMDEPTVLRLLEQLPDGVTEMYFHLATEHCPEIDRTMPDYRHEAELASLVSPVVRAAIEAQDVRLAAFSDLEHPRGTARF